jgi:hypothetical protein
VQSQVDRAFPGAFRSRKHQSTGLRTARGFANRAEAVDWIGGLSKTANAFVAMPRNRRRTGFAGMTKSNDFPGARDALPPIGDRRSWRRRRVGNHFRAFRAA